MAGCAAGDGRREVQQTAARYGTVQQPSTRSGTGWKPSMHEQEQGGFVDPADYASLQQTLGHTRATLDPQEKGDENERDAGALQPQYHGL